ncbi:MAG: phosphatidylserine decarboxylase family protein [Anaplasmataceae bacterium]|nr:phosphatidylserine decarboxylase family protein [Anaplasmataceae bacterium]
MDCKKYFKEITDSMTKIDKEGYPYVLIMGILTFIGAMYTPALGIILAILTILFLYFFRDPIRSVCQHESIILSPCDGVVTSLEHFCGRPLDEMQEGNWIKISAFLSPLNVHINRYPVNGLVAKIKHVEGKFLSAKNPNSSELNERNHMIISMENDIEILVTQVAGFIARRIVCHAKEGNKANIGEKYGIIKFGSRMDIYLPNTMNVIAKVGQTVVGGETILATMENFNINDLSIAPYAKI